jgi:Carboxypeptidase regulatory-like domain
MRIRAFFGCFVVFCLVLAMSAPNSSAQAVFGSVIGTVTDGQGNAVAGAKVTVTSITKSTVFETTTNDSGNFSVTHLIPDSYKVHIEATGFKAYDVASVAVSADSSVTLDAALQVGEVTQTIEVTGEIPQLKTDRADVDIQFSQKYVEDLPVLNRNFTSFELLSPGTQKLPGFNHAATENPQGGGQIQVNGQHFSGTNFELDGTDNQDPILGIIVVNPNLDAIGEAKIALQDYDAESGKATSGIVRVQTKSGSNEFHGSGFYYYRDSAQQARDPFTNKPGVALPAATWKQFGGADLWYHQPVHDSDSDGNPVLQSRDERCQRDSRLLRLERISECFRRTGKRTGLRPQHWRPCHGFGAYPVCEQPDSHWQDPPECGQRSCFISQSYGRWR